MSDPAGQNSRYEIDTDCKHLLRRRTFEVATFFDHRKWVYKQLKSTFDNNDRYSRASIAIPYFVRLCEVPLRWLLWAILGETQALELGKLARRIENEGASLPPDLDDVVFGRSLTETIIREFESRHLMDDTDDNSNSKTDLFLEAVRSVPSFKVHHFRNALAHSNYLVSKNGNILWRRYERYSFMPLPFFWRYVTATEEAVLPRVRRVFGQLGQTEVTEGNITEPDALAMLDYWLQPTRNSRG